MTMSPQPPTCLALHQPLPSGIFHLPGRTEQLTGDEIQVESKPLQNGTREEPGEIPGGDNSGLEKMSKPPGGGGMRLGLEG